MVEITILKVGHAGVDSAKELRPYIESNDVYCPEAAGHRHKEALRGRQSWLLRLEKPKSRMIKDYMMLYRSHHQELRDFALTRYDILYRNKKPILILERFSGEDSKLICANADFYVSHIDRSVKKIQEGEIDEPINVIRECVRRMRENTIRRDLMIARSLENVVGLAREVIPDANDDLKVVVEIGAAHQIEKYFSGECVLEDLSDGAELFYKMLMDQTQSKVPPTNNEILALADARRSLYEE